VPFFSLPIHDSAHQWNRRARGLFRRRSHALRRNEKKAKQDFAAIAVIFFAADFWSEQIP
jgi:hypothetical protein